MFIALLSKVLLLKINISLGEVDILGHLLTHLRPLLLLFSKSCTTLHIDSSSDENKVVVLDLRNGLGSDRILKQHVHHFAVN